MQNTKIVPHGWEEMSARNRYSPARRAGDFLFLSGVTGLGPDGRCPSDPEEQFRKAFDAITVTLEAGGAAWTDVVSMVSYHADGGANRLTFKRVLADYVQDPWPTWTAVGVTHLAHREMLVEVQVTAYLGG